ncbi:MAG TPA: restriction endonuclease subunit S [Phycisphaerae bacterium]|nr:restriction endonuclease subunit S [Phycisphaerae bacterium]
MKLKSLASIQAGYQFRRRIEPSEDGNASVIQVNDLKENHDLKSRRLARVKLAKGTESYRVQDGDVLFLSRGHKLFATAIANPPPDAIVPNYFYIIRPKTEYVLPEYLAWYINQPKTQSHLAPVRAGTYMPIVAKSDFSELEIEVPPIPVQRIIVALAELARRELSLLHNLQESRQQLIEQLCMQAAMRPTMKGKNNGQ